VRRPGARGHGAGEGSAWQLSSPARSFPARPRRPRRRPPTTTTRSARSPRRPGFGSWPAPGRRVSTSSRRGRAGL